MLPLLHRRRRPEWLYQTNTFHQTISSSSRIYQKELRQTIFARCSNCKCCCKARLTFRHPGLVEIRTIPAKKDIAFIEYADEAAATIAKDVLHNFKIDGETKMKVTYARR